MTPSSSDSWPGGPSTAKTSGTPAPTVTVSEQTLLRTCSRGVCPSNHTRAVAGISIVQNSVWASSTRPPNPSDDNNQCGYKTDCQTPPPSPSGSTNIATAHRRRSDVSRRLCPRPRPQGRQSRAVYSGPSLAQSHPVEGPRGRSQKTHPS